MTKINVYNILKDHWKTLVNDNTKEPSYGDIISFLAIPALVAILGITFFPHAPQKVSDTIITVLSIFIGLLINVTVLLFDLIKKDEKNGLKTEVLSQTLTNISYTSLISIFSIVVSLLTKVEEVEKVFSFLIYFLMTHILLTLMMVIKRIYILFKTEIDGIK